MGHISTLRVIFDLVPVVALMVTVDRSTPGVLRIAMPRNLWGDPRATLAVRSLLTQEEREAVRVAAGSPATETDPEVLCRRFREVHGKTPGG